MSLVSISSRFSCATEFGWLYQGSVVLNVGLSLACAVLRCRAHQLRSKFYAFYSSQQRARGVG